MPKRMNIKYGVKYGRSLELERVQSAIVQEDREYLEFKLEIFKEDNEYLRAEVEDLKDKLGKAKVLISRCSTDLMTLKKKLADEVLCCVCISVPRCHKILCCKNGHIVCEFCM